MYQGHTQTHTIANQQTENTDDCNTISEKISLHGTLYKPPTNNHSIEILRKLLIASFIAFIFLVAEIVGGVISGSLAILSDAAHMFSDLSGFFISIFAVWISSKPASKGLSFGYHRSEVIGALISIILIWVVTIILLYEATIRIVNKEPVEQPVYMLGTAVFGLICNLIMAKVLHSGPGHHHGCSHGHSHGDGHNHNHSYDHDDKNHNHNHKHQHDDKHQHEQNHKKSEYSEHQHEHKMHDHKEYDNMKARKQNDHKHDSKCQHNHQTDQNNQNQQNDIENQKNGHSHNHEEHSMKESCQYNNQDHNNNHNHDECKSNSDQEEQQQQKNNKNAKTIIAHQHSEKCDHDHNHDHNHDHDHNHNRESQQDKKKNISQVEAKDNYNLRAAMIHVLGDLLQSIGVLIAAFLIYFLGGDDGFNYWHLADPICTYIFSILVLLTTKNVSIDCFKVLMEGTPSQIDVQNFKEKLQKIANVMEIHDLHIWQLSQGKPSLTCHIFISENPREVLNKTTQLCRKYGIYHSTIQIEEWIMKEQPEYIKCDHNIHY